MFPKLVDRKRRGQVAVGIDLGEQFVGLLLDGRNSVGARNPAHGWMLLVDDGEQSVRELGGVAACLPLMASHAGRVWAVRSA